MNISQIANGGYESFELFKNGRFVGNADGLKGVQDFMCNNNYSLLRGSRNGEVYEFTYSRYNGTLLSQVVAIA